MFAGQGWGSDFTSPHTWLFATSLLSPPSRFWTEGKSRYFISGEIEGDTDTSTPTHTYFRITPSPFFPSNLQIVAKKKKKRFKDTTGEGGISSELLHLALPELWEEGGQASHNTRQTAASPPDAAGSCLSKQRTPGTYKQRRIPKRF